MNHFVTLALVSTVALSGASPPSDKRKSPVKPRSPSCFRESGSAS